MKKRLLLHVCCCPCAVYVYKKLAQDYDVTCFFYNPNIQPVKEYEFRKKELERIAASLNWDVVYADYHIDEWFQRVKGHEKDPERGERCSICFNMRLRETFQYAKENAFDVVTATLSISPYKATRQINAEGEQLSQEFGIEFLPENFKKQDGFNVGKKMATDLGVQHQDYCGCTYSQAEKELRQRKKR
jgi:predicted adenine nucleotide alpha hydrolase (AANH) superfamily ATPase